MRAAHPYFFMKKSFEIDINGVEDRADGDDGSELGREAKHAF